jgi:transcription-repair coupling factor (superfamily II helicase)
MTKVAFVGSLGDRSVRQKTGLRSTEQVATDDRSGSGRPCSRVRPRECPLERTTMSEPATSASASRSPDPVSTLASCMAVRSLASRLAAGGAVSARGAAGSSATVLAGALSRLLARPIVLIVAHLDEADDACDELLACGVEAVRFPALEASPGESGVNLELVAERARIALAVEGAGPPGVLIASIHALMQTIPPRDRLADVLRSIAVGGSLDLREFSAWLAHAGFRRVDAVEDAGQFSIRGGILDVFPPGGLPPVRVDLFGDAVESMWEIDIETMGSDRRIERADVLSMKAAETIGADGSRLLLEIMPPATVAMLREVMEITEQARGYFERLTDSRGVVTPREVFAACAARGHAVLDVNQYGGGSSGEAAVELPARDLPALPEEPAEGIAELARLAAASRVVVCCQNQGELDRFRELAGEKSSGEGVGGVIPAEIRYLHRGFTWEVVSESGEVRPVTFVPYHELLHRFHARRRVRRLAGGRAIDSFLDLQPGDFVVHREHGIAKFIAFGAMRDDPKRNRAAKATDEEFLTLEFAGGAKLHVPAQQIGLIQKYVGAFKGAPQLSTIGGRRWKKQKEDVAGAVRDLAKEMLQVQAARASMPGVRYPGDTAWQREFEAEFPYDETEDQLSAIAAVKKDMTGERPMDRLVCGDVGFGKTEVAIRAAFKAAEFGKQVAVLVPTTVLAEQHEITFRSRFKGYPFRIESLSRFKTKAEQNAILKEVKAGRVDVIIGTHRLLSQDVAFADLGLVIVDEEQRFGVEHKHRLLQFRMTADVLTLSATPIPRTLHMSLLGLRDISSLTTPPADRRAIVTEVIPYEKRRVQQAIERELAREGQVFFVHNRVYDIESIADDVRRLTPEARIVIGHGQMPPKQLEKVMLTFMRRQADILVCTTIIESGIDIPTANTMLIHDADMFGLSELHQLRGRVGRYKHRAYCYLMLPDDRTMTDAAVRRLRAIEDYSMLGAGFKIAMRDLEIRGAGNLLGAEQSGHISAVGYEMYCELLQEAVRDLKREKPAPRVECVVEIGVVGHFGKSYMPSDVRRLEAYRRLSLVRSIDDLNQVEKDLVAAYGEPPAPARDLLELTAVRALGTAIGVKSIVVQGEDVIFRTTRSRELEARFAGAMGMLRAVGEPDESGVMDVYYRPPKSFLEPSSLITVLRRRLAGETMADAAATSGIGRDSAARDGTARAAAPPRDRPARVRR